MRQAYPGELGRKIGELGKQIERRAKKLGLYEKGILMRPRDKSTAAFLEAFEHNLYVEVKDPEYNRLREERSGLIEEIGKAGRAELFEAVDAEWRSDLPEGRFLVGVGEVDDPFGNKSGRAY